MEWITNDPKKAVSILTRIKKENTYRFGSNTFEIIDLLIKQNMSLSDICWQLGWIASTIIEYVERNSPHELDLLKMNFSYDNVSQQEIDETKKALESIGIQLSEYGHIDPKDMEKASLFNIEELEKDKNNDGT